MNNTEVSNLTEVPNPVPLVPENMYGHLKRLDWIVSNISRSDAVVEFGCGTGYMITRPLCQSGYNAIGVDLDVASINYGREIFEMEGVKSERLKSCDVRDLDFTPDTIIASEVLEHIPDEQLSEIVQVIKGKLRADGTLLVTVPNGYGWFEMESFLWFKAGLGFVFRITGIAKIVSTLKRLMLGDDLGDRYPSTIADSPHVQRFTYRSIQELLVREGFEVKSIVGSVLFAGPFSNLFFTGIKPVMKFNCWLGSIFPRVAAGFYCYCKPAGPPDTAESAIVNGR